MISVRPVETRPSPPSPAAGSTSGPRVLRPGPSKVAILPLCPQQADVVGLSIRVVRGSHFRHVETGGQLGCSSEYSAGRIRDNSNSGRSDRGSRTSSAFRSNRCEQMPNHFNPTRRHPMADRCTQYQCPDPRPSSSNLSQCSPSRARICDRTQQLTYQSYRAGTGSGRAVTAD